MASSLVMTETVAGRYAATGDTLVREGPWQMLVSLNRNGVFTHLPVDLAVGPDGVARLVGEPLPVTVELVGWLNRYGNLILAALLLLVALGWGWIARRAWPVLRRFNARVGREARCCHSDEP